MNWITAQGGLPGEQFAQSVLNAESIQVMQLIIVLVVVALLIVIWLNGRSVTQMTGTQAGMARTNERFFEQDSKKTAVLQTAVDELRMLRESHDRQTLSHQRGLEDTVKAIKAHDEKSDAHVVSINAHTTQQREFASQDITNLMTEAVASVNIATASTFKPALEALVEIKTSVGAINTLQQQQMDLLKTQQDTQLDLLKAKQQEQMDFLKEQQEGFTRILNNILTRAEQTIIESMSEELHDETPDEIPPVHDHPDDAVEPALVTDGSSGPGSD